jgi:hypothetical protein
MRDERGPSSPSRSSTVPSDFDFVAERQLSSSIAQTVTTDVAGRLQLHVYARGNFGCSGAADHIICIVIDGDAVANSAFLRRATTDALEHVLTGITEGPAASGDHTIGVSAWEPRRRAPCPPPSSACRAW